MWQSVKLLGGSRAVPDHDVRDAATRDSSLRFAPNPGWPRVVALYVMLIGVSIVVSGPWTGQHDLTMGWIGVLLTVASAARLCWRNDVWIDISNRALFV